MRKLYAGAIIKKVMRTKMPEHNFLAIQLKLVLQYMYVVYFEEMTVRLDAPCVKRASVGCGLTRVGSRSTRASWLVYRVWQAREMGLLCSSVD